MFIISFLWTSLALVTLIKVSVRGRPGASTPAGRYSYDSTKSITTWNPSGNEILSVDDLKDVCGFKMSKSKNSSRSVTMPSLPGTKVMGNDDGSMLPNSFSWLDQKDRCPSLVQIRNQKLCGSCWAIAAAAVISDRHCLRTNETRIFSAKELVGCAEKSGCDGGDPKVAMNYFKEKGLVTGGDPTIAAQKKGCLPYPEDRKPQITCETKCVPKYDTPFESDKKKGVSDYVITTKNVIDIKLDLMRYGPLVATMDIYEDFRQYSNASGIYQRISDKLIGGHAVRLIGWGEENGIPFWIIANSWGTLWGINGFFKIVMGKNECLIEEYLVGVQTDKSDKVLTVIPKDAGSKNPKPASDAPKRNPSTAVPTVLPTTLPTVLPTAVPAAFTSTSTASLTSGTPLPLSEKDYYCDISVDTAMNFKSIGRISAGTLRGDGNIIGRIYAGTLRGDGNTIGRISAGTLRGDGNTICSNNGTIIGKNNIICLNQGYINGLNKLCAPNPGQPTHTLECDASEQKRCAGCQFAFIFFLSLKNTTSCG